MAEQLGPGHTIVTILCDYGTRYQSKLFNPEFLREKDLPVPSWLGLSRRLTRREQATHARSPGQHGMAGSPSGCPRRAGGGRHLVPAGHRAAIARAEYEAAHIPGAVFFDLDAVCEAKGLHPHMVPSAAKFSSRVRKLGLGDGSRIVVYDANRFFASARVWWLFRLHGP